MLKNDIPVFLVGCEIINVIVDYSDPQHRITRYYIKGEHLQLACIAPIQIIDGLSGGKETEVTVKNFVARPVRTFNVLPADNP